MKYIYISLLVGLGYLSTAQDVREEMRSSPTMQETIEMYTVVQMIIHQSRYALAGCVLASIVDIIKQQPSNAYVYAMSCQNWNHLRAFLILLRALQHVDPLQPLPVDRVQEDIVISEPGMFSPGGPAHLDPLTFRVLTKQT